MCCVDNADYMGRVDDVGYMDYVECVDYMDYVDYVDSMSYMDYTCYVCRVADMGPKRLLGLYVYGFCKIDGVNVLHGLFVMYG